MTPNIFLTIRRKADGSVLVFRQRERASKKKSSQLRFFRFLTRSTGGRGSLAVPSTFRRNWIGPRLLDHCTSTTVSDGLERLLAYTWLMRAMLMRTCLSDVVAPTVWQATKTVLERAGVTVVVPKTQTCCGQPGWSSGYPDQARVVARQALTAFAGTDPIVIPSGSCAAMLTHGYVDLFAGQPEEAAARDLAARTFEFSQFLVAYDLHIPPPDQGSVTYHDSCHMLRLLGEQGSPRAALGDLDLREMADTKVCCGFGGTFSVNFPEVSGSLGEAKARNAAETGAQTLVACDLSCLMHIAGRARRIGVPLRVRHLAEILAGDQ